MMQTFSSKIYSLFSLDNKKNINIYSIVYIADDFQI